MLYFAEKYEQAIVQGRRTLEKTAVLRDDEAVKRELLLLCDCLSDAYIECKRYNDAADVLKKACSVCRQIPCKERIIKYRLLIAALKIRSKMK